MSNPSDNDRVEALKFKDEGNAFVKKQDFARAVESYSKAIELDATVSIFYSNRAFAELKLDNFQTCMLDCTEAINIDPKNVKAYHRRGLSYVGLLEFRKAKKDLELVLKAKPGDATAKNAFQICEKFIREERFKKAIGGGAEDEAKHKICQLVPLNSFDANADLQNYTGPTLEFEQLTNEKNENCGIEVKNMSQDFISKMVNDLFLEGKTLPKKYAASIVSHAERLFRNEPTLIELENEKENQDVKISICGDTHGQFYDVLNIFKKYGKVGPKHTYLFNGDFVDRGSWSCEVALLFYSLKILFPTSFYLNRGNHETENMNKMYGFEDECKYKYSNRIFEMFSQSFETLPLATIVNNNYIIMHGGLPSDPNSTIDDIRNIDRFSQPPREGLFMELLWSDPQTANGLGPSQRGLGFSFGPDITTQYLKRNNLRKVLRSHEVRMGGIFFEHDKKLATVFSAPNYCDSQNNKGAIVHVVPGKGVAGEYNNDDGDLLIEIFEAVKHPDIKPMAYSNGGMGF